MLFIIVSVVLFVALVTVSILLVRANRKIKDLVARLDDTKRTRNILADNFGDAMTEVNRLLRKIHILKDHLGDEESAHCKALREINILTVKCGQLENDLKTECAEARDLINEKNEDIARLQSESKLLSVRNLFLTSKVEKLSVMSLLMVAAAKNQNLKLQERLLEKDEEIESLTAALDELHKEPVDFDDWDVVHMDMYM